MTRTKTAVLLGGSLGDVPLVRELHLAGMRVITVGGDASGAAHQVADEHITADFSDAEVCTAIARERQAIAVVPGSNDFAAISAAIVAERLGLPGHDPERAVLQINLKQQFRGIQAELGLPHPAFRCVDASSRFLGHVERMRLPVLIKPTDLTGGKGIRTVDRWEDLEPAVMAAHALSRCEEVLIEELLPGTRHGVTTLVVNGRIDFRFFDDEQYEPEGFRVVGATSPSSLSVAQRSAVIDQLDTLVDRLGLSDGLLHAQLVAGPGLPVLIEATRRLPGDLYARFVEIATGFPYTRAVVAPYLGAPIVVTGTETSQQPIARWVIVADQAGTYEGLDIDPELRSAVLETHHAVDPKGGEVSRPGQTLTVLMVDLARLRRSGKRWDGGSGGFAVPNIGT